MGICRIARLAALACLPWAVALLLPGETGVVRASDEELDFGLESRGVEQLDFAGNQVWTDEELTALLSLEGASWYAPWRSEKYRLDALEQGIDSIRRRYHSDGYRQATVELVEPEMVEGQGDRLKIVIVEGPRTVVARVEFEGAQPLSPAELEPLLRYKSGAAAPFSEAALGGDLFRVAEAYLSRGHLATMVETSLDQNDSTVVISYKIDAGPVYTIRNLSVQGYYRVREEYVRRELSIQVGQPFRTAEQIKSEARLLQTGWFRDVSFQATNLDPETAEADLVVVVLERATGFWEVGLGTGSIDRVRVVGAWGNRNVFGTGKGLTLRARLFGIYDVSVEDPGKNQLYWDHEEELIYRHPHFFGSGRTITARLFTELESRPSSGMQLNQFGVSMSTSLLNWQSSLLDIEYALTRTRKESLSEDIVFDNSRALTSAVAMVYRRDFRDDIFNPSAGHYVELFGQTAGGPLLLGDNSFNKLLSRGVKILSFGDAVFAMRLEAGWIRAYSTSKEIWGPDTGVPIEERYFAGGNNTVRGYRESSLGPRLSEDDATLVQDPQLLTERLSGGGNAVLLANFEMRFPIIAEWNIGGEFFFDTGNVWTNWTTMTTDDFRLSGDVVDKAAETAYRTSYGVGITYRTVVGPLRLDYGIPLRRATFNSRNEMGEITGTERDPDHVWHFSLGHAF